MLISLTLVVKRECCIVCYTVGHLQRYNEPFQRLRSWFHIWYWPLLSISGLPSHGPEKNIKNVLISSCPTTHTIPIHEKRTAPPACLHKLATWLSQSRARRATASSACFSFSFVQLGRADGLPLSFLSPCSYSASRTRTRAGARYSTGPSFSRCLSVVVREDRRIIPHTSCCFRVITTSHGEIIVLLQRRASREMRQSTTWVTEDSAWSLSRGPRKSTGTGLPWTTGRRRTGAACTDEMTTPSSD
jgi:hypothetical protein